MPFAPVPPHVDLPALERDVLARWDRERIFERALERTAGGPLWTWYEGPPTANGMPGVHHVAARTFKDLFPRFKTMRGWHVPRQGGWDCHGLPVEVAVERALGLSGKKDIEAYGIAAFNERCRESVLRHVDAWRTMSRRMGSWSDDEHAYRTMDRSYIESVWWSLKVIFDKGLLVRDHRISPYCPRCGTPLSDHEMGQPDVYRTVTDPAVTVRFPLTSLPRAGAGQDGDAKPLPAALARADLLVWTTAPWTLLANAAVAVHPDAVYALARRSRDGAQAVVADDVFARVLGDGWHVAARFRGEQLTGAGYQPPFVMTGVPESPVVIPGSFVTTQEGTGLVHIAPAFGADDRAAALRHGLPVVNPVRPDGRFAEDVPVAGGLPVRDANQRLIADLDDRGLLFGVSPFPHAYPHCWRCGTPLLYYALPSWFIKTTAVKAELLAQNAATNWYPPSVRDGRYGQWLRGNVDWALSRTRYWGTPLPLWECPDGHVTCVESLTALSGLAGRDLRDLDPHRPYVDSVTFACPSCGALARRVPEVIDVWYDSGAMPFARIGAPWRSLPEFRATYPARFICEGIDQTRGWFYALMAVGTMVFGTSAYENVLCLGLLTDEQGRTMSTHLGNVLDPLALMERYGADALRWFFAATGSPWSARRLTPDALGEIVRQVLLTYWNTVSFFVRYANAAGWSTGPAGPSRSLLDRWLLSTLHTLVKDVTGALESFDATAAGRRIAAFVDDLSNWYVRVSRQSFRDGTAGSLATLHECLVTLTLLMAPFAPFLTEHVWGVLGGSDSVHLAAWPCCDEAMIDDSLNARMTLVRRLAALGRSARARAGVPNRQPLGRALIGAGGPGAGGPGALGFEALPTELVELLRASLNVGDIAALAGSGELTDYTVKPAFRSLGPRFGPATAAVAAAIAAAPAAELATAVLSGDSYSVTVGGAPVSLTASDVVVTRKPRSGWTVASDHGLTVALDTTLTPSLRSQGVAREVIRMVQEERKHLGLAITDRIWLRVAAGAGPVREALSTHASLIAGEVLAADYAVLPPPSGSAPDPGCAPVSGSASGPCPASEFSDDGLGVHIWLRRVDI